MEITIEKAEKGYWRDEIAKSGWPQLAGCEEPRTGSDCDIPLYFRDGTQTTIRADARRISAKHIQLRAGQELGVPEGLDEYLVNITDDRGKEEIPVVRSADGSQGFAAWRGVESEKLREVLSYY